MRIKVDRYAGTRGDVVITTIALALLLAMLAACGGRLSVQPLGSERAAKYLLATAEAVTLYADIVIEAEEGGLIATEEAAELLDVADKIAELGMHAVELSRVAGSDQALLTTIREMLEIVETAIDQQGIGQWLSRGRALLFGIQASLTLVDMEVR